MRTKRHVGELDASHSLCGRPCSDLPPAEFVTKNEICRHCFKKACATHPHGWSLQGTHGPAFTWTPSGSAWREFTITITNPVIFTPNNNSAATGVSSRCDA